MEGKEQLPAGEDEDYSSDDWPYAEASYFVEASQTAPEHFPDVDALPEIEEVVVHVEEALPQESIPNPDPIVEAERVDNEIELSEPEVLEESVLGESEFAESQAADVKQLETEVVPDSPIEEPALDLRRHSFIPLIIVALCALLLSIGFYATDTAPPAKVQTVDDLGIDPALLERFLAIDRLFVKAEKENRNEFAELTGGELISMLTVENLKGKKADLALVEAAIRRDERITSVLSELSQNKDPAVRAKAIKALGSPFHLEQEVGYDAVLVRLKRDKDNLVRAYAAKTLSNSSHSEALSLLQKQLRNEDNSFVNAVLIRSIEKIMKNSPE